MKTKYILIAVFAICMAYFLWPSPSVKSAIQPGDLAKGDRISNNQALDAVRAEIKVKDVVITDANVLYVSVVDDGTRRDGYAEYLCALLKEYHSTVNRVKVIKSNSSNSPKKNTPYGILIGETRCR